MPSAARLQAAMAEPLGALLTAGGDGRIALDAGALANAYGCRPWPDARIAPYGSSTASTVSEAGWRAAEALADRVGASPSRTMEAFEALRCELVALCGLRGAAPEVVFAASGTDLHLIAAWLLDAEARGRPATVIAIDAAETGSGVPAALGFRHFSGATARGGTVALGAPIGAAEPAEQISVRVREDDGALRPAHALDADVEAAAETAVQRGRRVLLVAADVSKTGAVAPSAACAVRLKAAFPNDLEVLVDGCQFRLSGETVGAYLRRGFLVAVTGSKFLTGPAFSGALLIPRALAERLRRVALSAEAALYSSAAEWPCGWAATRALSGEPNLGLLLRWEAAMAEFRRFAALDPAAVQRFFDAFASAAGARLETDRVLEPLPPAPLTRGGDDASAGWDAVPTIFPFRLRHSAPRTFRPRLSVEETKRAHGLLRTDLGNLWDDPAVAALAVELGQPVAVGCIDGAQTAALRLCNSARLAVRALGADGVGEGAVIAQAMAALDKAALVARAISQGWA